MKITNYLKFTTGLLTLSFLFLVQSVFAAGFSAVETQANLASVSVPTINLTGGVNTTLAVTEVGIVGLISGAASVTIGDCVISFPDFELPQEDELDCSDNVAVTNDGTGGLGGITNISQDGNPIVVDTDGIFSITLTAGSEEDDTVDGFINFVDGTGGTLDVISETAGVTVAAHQTITITGALPANAADQSLNIDGLGVIPLGSSSRTAAQVAAAIKEAVTGAPGYAAKNYIAGGTGANIDFERKNGGPDGNGAITITDGTYGSLAQIVAFTPTDIVDGYDYDFSVTINGTTYNHLTNSSNVQSIVEALQPAVDAHASVVCSEDDIKITCTAATPGTAFTYSAAVTATLIPTQQDSGSRRTGSTKVGEGVTNSTNPATLAVISSIYEQIRVLQELVSKQVEIEKNQRGYFSRNLRYGSVGEDVKRLQEFLNGNGFALPGTNTGAGSPGRETTYFGMLTKNAVIEFQKVHGITPSGIFGPKTRAKINPLLDL